MQKDVVIIEGGKIGIAVDIREGHIGLVRVDLKGDGVFHTMWVFLSKWVGGVSKPTGEARPMSVYLGKDKARAVDYLRQLAGIILKGC
jgi:hypothetical protein